MARRPKPLQRQRTERAGEIRAQYSEVAGTRELLSLKQIAPRVDGDTRPLNQQHVSDLAESIEILGLISPLTIDQEGKLLAGGHRRAALDLIAEQSPERFAEHFSEGIPVYRLDLRSEEAPIEALQVEIEENTQRRNYTADEIRQAAKRLEAEGFEKLKGRPREGQRSLKQALQRIFKLSDRRIQAILNDQPDQANSPPLITKRVISSTQRKATREIQKLTEQLEQYADATPAQRAAVIQLKSALITLESLASELK